MTGGILAHEFMHAWLRLQGDLNLIVFRRRREISDQDLWWDAKDS